MKPTGLDFLRYPVVMYSVFKLTVVDCWSSELQYVLQFWFSLVHPSLPRNVC